MPVFVLENGRQYLASSSEKFTNILSVIIIFCSISILEIWLIPVEKHACYFEGFEFAGFD